eukprot:116812_1
MGSCWSSPPVVEQEVELPDLENQLSAPKPRPTAATSWTHKPAILIPATLVCLILSGFALSIFLGYNSMSETRPGSTKISIPSGNTTPIATQSGKSSASEQIDDDITIHHPTRTVTPPNKSVTTEELVSDPLQSDSEIISGGLDNSHVLEDPAKTITKPTVNIPNSNGTQPLESDSSSNILSPPKSAGTTSVETDKSSTVQNPANSATKTLGKSTSKIIVEDQAKPIAVEIVIQVTDDGSTTWMDPENEEDEMEDFQDVLGYIVKKVIAPTFMEREITDHEFLNKINTDRLKSYNKRKAKLFRSTSKKEIRITTFVPKDITFGEAEMRVYLAPNLMTNYYNSPKNANLDGDLTKTKTDIIGELFDKFRIDASVTVSKFNEAGKPILPIISSTTDKSNSGQSSSETLNTSTLKISKSDNDNFPAPKPSTVEIVIKFTDDGKEYSYLPNVPLDYLAREVIAPIFVKDGINIYDGIIYTKHETTKKYNKEKTLGEKYGSFQIITLFVAENRTVGKAELMR